MLQIQASGAFEGKVTIIPSPPAPGVPATAARNSSWITEAIPIPNNVTAVATAFGNDIIPQVKETWTTISPWVQEGWSAIVSGVEGVASAIRAMPPEEAAALEITAVVVAAPA